MAQQMGVGAVGLPLSPPLHHAPSHSSPCTLSHTPFPANHHHSRIFPLSACPSISTLNSLYTLQPTFHSCHLLLPACNHSRRAAKNAEPAERALSVSCPRTLIIALPSPESPARAHPASRFVRFASFSLPCPCLSHDSGLARPFLVHFYCLQSISIVRNQKNRA